MLVLGGETLVARAVRLAGEAGLEPVLVVVSPEAEFVASLQGLECRVVVNAEAAEGMAASIRHGVAAAMALKVDGAVVMACDQVGLRAGHLQALCEDHARVTGSFYAEKIGVPAYFPAASFAALMELRGDVGARALLRGAFAVADEGLVMDVDTEEDVERARGYSKLPKDVDLK